MNFSLPYYSKIVQQIKSSPCDTLGNIIEFSTENWSQKDIFTNTFPYIEIAGVPPGRNEYEIVETNVAEAPSRAKMIVRNEDIIVSTTRPHRGAIAKINCEYDEITIASTGFCVLRKIKRDDVLKEYLPYVLLSDGVLKQMAQRSSGGNYPAIIPDEMKKIVIPIVDPQKQKQLVSNMFVASQQRSIKLREAYDFLENICESVLKQLGIGKISILPRDAVAVTLGTLKKDKTLGAGYYHTERISTIRALERYESMSTRKLEDIVDFLRNIVSADGGGSYLGLASVMSNIGELSGVEEEAEGQALEYDAGDVLYAKLRPYLNKVIYMETGGICSTEFHVMRIKCDDVLPEYLAAVMRSKIIVAQTKHMMTGNTHPRISDDDVRNLRIPIPPMGIQQFIVNDIRKRMEESRKLRREAEAEWTEAKEQFEQELKKSQ